MMVACFAMTLVCQALPGTSAVPLPLHPTGLPNFNVVTGESLLIDVKVSCPFTCIKKLSAHLGFGSTKALSLVSKWSWLDNHYDKMS
jgi:hypothetical protein